jgi:hypothetical protein
MSKEKGLNNRGRAAASFEFFGNLPSSFEESPDDLESLDAQGMVPIVILAYLSQTDEAAFSRLRKNKRG